MVQSAETCSETSPQVFGAVALYVRSATATYIVLCLFSLACYGDLPFRLSPEQMVPDGRQNVWSLITVEAGSDELINKEDGDFLECLICFNSFAEANETIVKTRCGHYWHRECLATWCRTCQTCPHCRTALFEPVV